jgi:ABC-type sulfate transport system substrate-binding protein
VIGQPPRLKSEGYDKHEQDRWFQDIYRYLQTLTPSSGGGGSTTTNVTNEYGSSSTTIEQNITGTSKRYLRWFGC